MRTLILISIGSIIGTALGIGIAISPDRTTADVLFTIAVALGLVWVVAFAARRRANPQQRYTYKYLRYPWDTPQYFVVLAHSQEEANKLALVKLADMLRLKLTVMDEIYPVITP